MPYRASFLVALILIYWTAPGFGQGLVPQLRPGESNLGQFARSDSTGIDSTRKSKDTTALDIDDVKNIHREFDHREQVITASAFMGALIFLMSSMNNFNPRPVK